MWIPGSISRIWTNFIDKSFSVREVKENLLNSFDWEPWLYIREEAELVYLITNDFLNWIFEVIRDIQKLPNYSIYIYSNE